MKPLPSQKQTSKIREIELALKACAEIVVQFGEVYYPIFERLEKELEEAQKQQSTRSRALNYISGKVDAHAPS